jgi:hypothetical protein
MERGQGCVRGDLGVQYVEYLRDPAPFLGKRH